MLLLAEFDSDFESLEHRLLILFVDDIVLIVSILIQDSTCFGKLGSGNLGTVRASGSDIASADYESGRSHDSRNWICSHADLYLLERQWTCCNGLCHFVHVDFDLVTIRIFRPSEVECPQQSRCGKEEPSLCNVDAWTESSSCTKCPVVSMTRIR